MTHTHVAWLFISGLLVAGCGQQSDRESAPPTPVGGKPPVETRKAEDPSVLKVEPEMLRDLRVTIEAVESRQGGEQVTLLGELHVDQRSYAEVGVPMSARVTALLASPGESVRQGQVLAELTSPDLGKARAEFLSAQARTKVAQEVLTRKRALAEERIAPLREVQDAEADVEERRAALRSLRAVIESFGAPVPVEDASEATSSVFTLRAPVAGVVLERAAVIGQMLDPSKPAFRIGDMSTLWLTVHAFERDAVRIAQGAPARLKFPALPGRDFPGTVAMVGREVAAESRTIPVRIDVRNSGNLLRPGMSATAMLAVGNSGTPILTVPVAAVQRVREDWCVFLPKDAATFEIRRIGRGRDLGGEVEVVSGLTSGEKIVVDGAFLLKAQAEKAEGNHDAH